VRDRLISVNLSGRESHRPDVALVKIRNPQFAVRLFLQSYIENDVDLDLAIPGLNERERKSLIGCPNNRIPHRRILVCIFCRGWAKF
jgi:hypothetical protein